MTRSIPACLCVAAVAMIALIGCGSEPVSAPSSPQITPSIEAQNSEGLHECLGFYLLHVETASGTVEVAFPRALNLHLNMVSVLNSTMGVQAVPVPADSDPANGIFAFDITLTHPFGTKPQLAGFDVKGILITPGTFAISTVMLAGLDETRLLNSDGYTRWWNPAEFTQPGLMGYTQGNLTHSQPADLTAEINPYKHFADILGSQDGLDILNSVPLDDSQGRGVFTAGSANTRRFRIQFPMNPGPQIVYGYAVDACWALPSPNPPAEIPDNFPINANQPEAYRIDLTTPVNTLYYDSETGHGGGVLRLDATIRDWQGILAGDVTAEIGTVRTYCPDLFTGSADLTAQSDPLAGTAQYYTDLWHVAIPTQPGDYLLALRAESKNGPAYVQGSAPAPAGNISAWQVMTIPVVDPECEPDSNNSPAEAETVGLIGTATGVLCPVEDPSDYFKITIPPGYELAGTITFTHDAFNQGSQALTLSDSHGVEMTQSVSSDGVCEIDMFGLNLFPGDYYIKLSAILDTGPFAYLLETRVILMSIKPSDPVDITPNGLDCFASWVDADAAASDSLYAAGPAGTFNLTAVDMHTVGRVVDPMGTDPAFSYPYMYYVEDNYTTPIGIDLDDYTDAANPVHHEDVLMFDAYVRCMTMNAQNLYVVVDNEDQERIYIYDYTGDPANPVYVDDFAVTADQRQIGLMDYLAPPTHLVSMSDHFLALYDVEDPHNCTYVDGVIMADNFLNEDLDIDLKYMVRTYLDTDDMSGHLQIVEWDDFTNKLVDWGDLDLEGQGYSVAADSYFAYVENGPQGITCLTYPSLNNVQLMDSVDPVGPVEDLDVSGQYLCSAEGLEGPAIYDVSDKLNIVPSERGKFINCPVAGAARNLTYTYFIEAYVGSGAVKALETTGLDTATVTQETLLSGEPSSIAVLSGILLVGSYSDNTVWLFDITDPLSPPVPVYENSYGSGVTSVAVSSYAAYIALQDGTMKILDLSNFPSEATEAPDYDFPGELYNLVRSDHYLFGTYLDNAVIFDIASPLDPYYIGNYSYGGSDDITDLEFQGYYLYLSTSDTLRIADFFNPYAPLPATGLNLPYASVQHGFAVGGSYAYVTDMAHNPTVVTLYPPDSPEIFGEPFGEPWPFAIIGNVVFRDKMYLMHYYRGLRIFDLY